MTASNAATPSARSPVVSRAAASLNRAHGSPLPLAAHVVSGMSPNNVSRNSVTMTACCDPHVSVRRPGDPDRADLREIRLELAIECRAPLAPEGANGDLVAAAPVHG